MKLCYRGVDYDYNPPSLEVRDSEILGRYRGRSQNFRYVSHVPVPQPVASYTYRGVGYSTNAQGQVVAPVSVEAAAEAAVPQRQPVFQVARINGQMDGLKARRHLMREAAEAHRTNIQRSIQRRIEVARAQGNDQLLRQLEDELHQLA